MRLQTPPWPGTYRLRISAVQEMVAWFDDLSPENGQEERVAIVPAMQPRAGREVEAWPPYVDRGALLAPASR